MVWGRENHILGGGRPGDLLGPAMRLVWDWLDGREGLLRGEVYRGVSIVMVVCIVIRGRGRGF